MMTWCARTAQTHAELVLGLGLHSGDGFTDDVVFTQPLPQVDHLAALRAKGME